MNVSPEVKELEYRLMSIQNRRRPSTPFDNLEVTLTCRRTQAILADSSRWERSRLVSVSDCCYGKSCESLLSAKRYARSNSEPLAVSAGGNPRMSLEQVAEKCDILITDGITDFLHRAMVTFQQALGGGDP